MDDLTQMLKDRIDALEERVRQLEDILSPPTAVIPIEWRLSPAEARVFAHLTTRELASKASIMAALYSDRPDDEVHEKIVDVFVCKMRAKLKPFGVEIITAWGSGYSLRSREQFSGKVAA